MKTLYDRLGVSRFATLQELELAYRRQLEQQMRATRTPLGRIAQRRLRGLREAFVLLASPTRRASYDQQLVLRQQRRARLLRHGATLVSASLVVVGFALIGGAWYQNADARAVPNSAAAAPASLTSSGGMPELSTRKSAGR